MTRFRLTKGEFTLLDKTFYKLGASFHTNEYEGSSQILENDGGGRLILAESDGSYWIMVEPEECDAP